MLRILVVLLCAEPVQQLSNVRYLSNESKEYKESKESGKESKESGKESKESGKESKESGKESKESGKESKAFKLNAFFRKIYGRKCCVCKRNHLLT